MYLEHFGLRELPFTITPNPAFAHATQAHRASLGGVLQALEDGESLIKLTGEVGTGKTLACRCLLAQLAHRPAWVTAFLPNPGLSPRAFLQSIADELTLEVCKDADEHELSALLTRRLHTIAAAGRRLVLCLDEAQAMPVATLETLRLLSQAAGQDGSLQVLLVGQPELDTKLAQHGLRALAQRISSHHAMGRLRADETGPYVAHRLQMAGYGGAHGALFPSAALMELARRARGTPRLVNVIAHKALQLAHSESSPCVNAGHVRGAAAQTPNAQGPLNLIGARVLDWCQALLEPARPGVS